MNSLLRRKAAIEAVLEKYKDAPRVWGEADCAHTTALLLRELGHKPGLSRFGKYNSAETAYRRLRARKFSDTTDWMDSIKTLRPIPPAYALPGDILAFPSGEGEMTALAIHLGGTKFLAFAAQAPHPFAVHDRNMLPLRCWSASCPS